MSEYKDIPLLTARDVELRAALERNGVIIMLVYKDARVDMRILNECFGCFNWQRKHEVINGNNYCTVSIKNQETGEWISKQDVGKPSKTEAEKGEASDSFKRACFNWGIGVELYDAPDIKIKLNDSDYWKVSEDKKILVTKFKVSYMKYNKELHQFDEFVVVDNNGRIRFELNAEKDNASIDKPVHNAQKQAYTQSNLQKNTNVAAAVEKAFTKQPQADTKNAHCAECGLAVSEKVFQFSSKKFGRPLCMNCQKLNG